MLAKNRPGVYDAVSNQLKFPPVFSIPHEVGNEAFSKEHAQGIGEGIDVVVVAGIAVVVVVVEGIVVIVVVV